MPIRISALVTIVALAACSGGASPGNGDPGDPGDTTPTDSPADATTTPTDQTRPETRTDTVYLEGMPESMTLRLFRPPDDFPLPFSAYAPEDFEVEPEGENAVQLVAAFGGQRNADAFVHVYVYPEGTDAQAAVGTLRAFGASRGIPVSMGIEPLPEPDVAHRMPWADRGFSFRYQADEGWVHGNMGLGRHDGRYFHIVTHYPAEYGDGFGPRVARIMETWQWADGSPLAPS